MKRSFEPLHQSDFIYYKTKQGKEYTRCLNVLHSFTEGVIREREIDYQKNVFIPEKRIAFLDMLLREKNENSSLTSKDIQEEVDTFMFEGHDTTSSSVSWTCHLIGTYPDVQKKLHDEVDRIFGKILDFD